LDQAGLASVDISLYGFSEVSYQKLTGKEGMFDKTISGIKNAIAQGFSVNINIILHRYNIDEIKLMASFCTESLIAFQFSTEITERYDDSSGSKDFEITEAQFKEQLAGEFSDIFMVLNPDKALQCSCAKSVCGISYSGEVFPCIGAPIPSGNLREKSFTEIWKNSEVFKKIRNLKREDFKSCQSCDHIEFCNRSSGSIYSNTKEYTGCDASTLQQAKIRHEFYKKNQPN
jgi:radical SAM protein with 4Fe4S-binding SPASM domain